MAGGEFGEEEAWIGVSDSSTHSANSAESGAIQESSEPLGPRSDSVFPSLPSAERPISSVDEGEWLLPSVAAVPLAGHIFTLTPIPPGMSRAELLERAEQFATAPRDQRIGEFERPERDRIFNIAETFIRGHVRRIAKGASIRTPHSHFQVGTIVISEDLIPKTRLRHAIVQWAVTPTGIVALKNARLPAGHLESVQLGSRPILASPHRGDDCDVAFLLAYICELLGIVVDSSIAGVGTVALQDNHLLIQPDIDSYLDGARDDHIAEVIIPHSNGKMNGEHEGVQYWSAHDTNESIFSLFTALAREEVVPNLYRRAMTKEAYSWLSLVLILIAVCGYQLAVAFGGHPPVEFVRYLLAVVALLFVGSLAFTHRFGRFDR